MGDRETLIHWLRDAYAMEKASIELQEKLDQRLDEYPEVSQHIRRHIQETQEQANQLERCLNNLNADTSGMKDLIAKSIINIEAMKASMSDDAIIKNLLMGYAFEQFEVACYRSLVAAAEELNEQEVMRACSRILHQEERMAVYVQELIPDLTQEFLQAKTAGGA